MKKYLLLWLWLCLGIGLMVGRTVPATAEETRQVLVLRFSGPVTPAMLAYLERGLREAETMGAEAVVFVLDTPGGSVDITRRIVQAIEQSSVPVIVYISPPRAWAASAGTLITLAGHAAVMAPETMIGAASPVAVGGEELPETARTKAEQAVAAMARSLASRRGEQVARWAAETVTAARASTAQEALEIGAIDAIAIDLQDLFAQLDGTTVRMPEGERTLHLAGARPVEFSSNFFEQFLAVLSNPVVAAILLTLGLNALLYELSAPGGYVAGAIGIIALLLAFYALGTLEANWAGLAFIVVAFALFAVELKAHSGGILTVAGLASFVIGTAMLFNTPYYPIPWAAIIGLAAAMGLFVAVALRLVIQTQRQPSVSGDEALRRSPAVARTRLDPEGMVLAWGTLWQATAEGGPIEAGSRVVITRREGHRLWVRPAEAEK
jgi:membrane-bound serine protease (ClpP class)